MDEVVYKKFCKLYIKKSKNLTEMEVKRVNPSYK